MTPTSKIHLELLLFSTIISPVSHLLPISPGFSLTTPPEQPSGSFKKCKSDPVSQGLYLSIAARCTLDMTSLCSQGLYPLPTSPSVLQTSPVTLRTFQPAGSAYKSSDSPFLFQLTLSGWFFSPFFTWLNPSGQWWYITSSEMPFLTSPSPQLILHHNFLSLSLLSLHKDLKSHIYLNDI